MQKVAKTIERVASADVSVMLLGASGTGKELLARAVHEKSSRKGEFIAINCAAIPENLLEAELFGYERGAFTGAVKSNVGKIELAQGGTLFLDEVGDIPLPLQVKLLRFLQERVIERIGGRSGIAVDTRIVCATHQDLEAMIAGGRFREDLYYRLHVVPCAMPPLRRGIAGGRNCCRRWRGSSRGTRGGTRSIRGASEAWWRLPGWRRLLQSCSRSSAGRPRCSAATCGTCLRIRTSRSRSPGRCSSGRSDTRERTARRWRA